MKVGDRYFGGGDQIVVTIGELEEVLLEFRELSGAAKRIGVDDVRRHDFPVTARRVLIEKEIDQRTIETRARTADEREAGAGDFGAAVEVEDAQTFANVPVGLRLKIELRLLAPGSLDAIRRFAQARGFESRCEAAECFEVIRIIR